MDAKQVKGARDLQFRHLRTHIDIYLERTLNVIPETDINIYIDYPTGWHATFGANHRVYIITSTWGVLSLEIEPLIGFGKNGALLRSSFFRKGKNNEC